MQPIQRAPCPDAPTSSAAYLAALIDGQARAGRAPADPPPGPGAASRPADGRDGAVLIWVEGAMDGPGPAPGRSRGMIVAAHGPSPAAAERTLVVSYPIEDGGPAQCIPAVLGLLRAKGWSLLASCHKRTATGHANTAVLVNVGLGGERRLWLAEPVPASRAQGRARKPGLPHPPRAAAAPAALARRRQGRAWTEDGAGGGPGA